MKFIDSLKQTSQDLAGSNLIDFLNQVKYYLQNTKEVNYIEANEALQLIDSILKQETKKMNQPRYYCAELFNMFATFAEENMQDKSNYRKQELKEKIDLLRAINTYRECKTIDEVFRKYPHLEPEKEVCTMLFNHLDDLGYEGVSLLFLQTIKEVY